LAAKQDAEDRFQVLAARVDVLRSQLYIVNRILLALIEAESGRNTSTSSDLVNALARREVPSMNTYPDITIPLTGQEIAAATTPFHDPAAATSPDTSPLGFLSAAEQYMLVVDCLAKLPANVAELPWLHSTAQVLEETLKAYLCENEKPWGHKVTKLWMDAVGVSSKAIATKKLSIASTPPEWCKTLQAFHDRPSLDRYPPRYGLVYGLPDRTELARELRNLIVQVKSAIS
jgi:hypothetical protein